MCVTQTCVTRVIAVAGLAIALSSGTASAQEDQDRVPERDRLDRREEPGYEFDGDFESRIAPRPDRERGIQLGVYADPVGAGYRIHGVVARSPAAQAGLEPGDVILAVDGYQVGELGRDFFPLSAELQRRAQRDRHAILLVRNVRDGSVINLDVSFRNRPFPRDPWFRERDGGEAPLGTRLEDRLENRRRGGSEEAARRGRDRSESRSTGPSERDRPTAGDEQPDGDSETPDEEAPRGEERQGGVRGEARGEIQ